MHSGMHSGLTSALLEALGLAAVLYVVLKKKKTLERTDSAYTYELKVFRIFIVNGNKKIKRLKHEVLSARQQHVECIMRCPVARFKMKKAQASISLYFLFFRIFFEGNVSFH